jgi:hypothetical protein
MQLLLSKIAAQGTLPPPDRTLDITILFALLSSKNDGKRGRNGPFRAVKDVSKSFSLAPQARAQPKAQRP